MFGSWVLEIAVGLIFVFLLFSTICAAIREAIETVTKTRAAYLERGIREILHDLDGAGLARKFYEHPLIYSLYGGEYQPGSKDPKPNILGRGGRLPSYIPAKNFAAALIDIAARGAPPDLPDKKGDSSRANDPGLDNRAITLESLRAGIVVMENQRVARALLNALDLAENDLNKARLNLEAWYDGTMDRVSGWYKRSTQWIVFWLALATAVVLNVDAIGIANFLYRNDNARHAVVAQAEVAVAEVNAASARTYVEQMKTELNTLSARNAADADIKKAEEAVTRAQKEEQEALAREQVARLRADAARSAAGAPARDAQAKPAGTLTPSQKIGMAKAELDSLDLPIGWDASMSCNYLLKGGAISCATKHLLIGLGWLLTALAATLGAPFWFDILNKVMVIRSTVKPYEKSKPEGSEDRQNLELSALTATLRQQAAAAAAGAAGAVGGLGLAAAGTQPAQAAPAREDAHDGCAHAGDDPTPDDQLPPAEGGVR